jgi:uncharacterized membrane protein HdeD (DUF308 family)
MARSKHWFASNVPDSGWGWPIAWQGWLVLAAYVLALFFLPQLYSPREHIAEFLACVVAVSAVLVVVFRVKGQPKSGEG